MPSLGNCPECSNATEYCVCREFEPCAVYYEDQRCTEVVLKDVAIIWSVFGFGPVEIGRDMETGELVAVRLPTDVTRFRKSPVNG